MKLRVVLLAIGALCLAGLTQCTTDDGVWILPVLPETPTVPISPVSPVGISGSEFGILSSESGVSSSEVRETAIRPRWDESTLEPGDLVVFECELRPGGSGAAVDGQQFTLAYGQQRALWWDVAGLEPGWWEVFCRPSARGRAMVELINSESQNCARGCGFAFVEHWEQ
jgi:hypothetical protein